MKISIFIILFCISNIVAQVDSNESKTIDVIINYAYKHDNSMVRDTNIRITIYKDDKVYFDTLRKDTLPITIRLNFNQIYQLESTINGEYLFHKTHLGFQTQKNVNQISKTFIIKKSYNKIDFYDKAPIPFKLSKKDSLLSWNNLRFRTKEVYFEEFSAYGRKPVFTEKNFSLEGKEFIIHGYLEANTYDDKLTLYKPGAIEGCNISLDGQVYGESKFIEVNLTDSLFKMPKYTKKEVYIKGKIKLNIDDFSRCSYILNNSVILYAKEIPTHNTIYNK